MVPRRRCAATCARFSRPFRCSGWMDRATFPPATGPSRSVAIRKSRPADDPSTGAGPIRGVLGLEQTWRWFGPEDAITLPEICQTGATGIVTALHHIPYGLVWDGEEISKRKWLIESDRSLELRWSVVESLPVAESIKLGEGNLVQVFDNYRASLRNLGIAGV